MPNTLAKTRTTDAPYAVYESPVGMFTWHVLKTYKTPKSEAKDPYARWLVAAKSDATYGSFEMGDTYAQEVQSYGRLVAADPLWLEAYGIDKKLPTPEEYYAAA
ncbi:MAG: hypothetical protein GY854_23525 [Deltaproteobacteria bacterium]|nr:hypothetical protein [Deltaproteobacteria bacterium]